MLSLYSTSELHAQGHPPLPAMALSARSSAKILLSNHSLLSFPLASSFLNSIVIQCLFPHQRLSFLGCPLSSTLLKLSQKGHYCVPEGFLASLPSLFNLVAWEAASFIFHPSSRATLSSATFCMYVRRVCTELCCQPLEVLPKSGCPLHLRSFVTFSSFICPVVIL